MLKTFYDTLGFGLSLLSAFILFLVFIFWIAGLSGILIRQRENHRSMPWQIALSVVFFPYPILWMIADMIRQRRMI